MEAVDRLHSLYYVKVPEKRFDQLKFDTNIAKFTEGFRGAIDEVNALNIKWRGGQKLSQASEDYVIAAGKLHALTKGGALKKLTVTMLGNNNTHDETMRKMNEIWEEFKLFNDAISKYRRENSPDSEIPIALRVKLVAATKSFAAANDTIRDYYFEFFRSEALQVKLARAKAAAHLIARNKDNLPAGYADKYLKNMASKLNCLTQYAVGPKYDQKRAGRLSVPLINHNTTADPGEKKKKANQSPPLR